MRRALVGLAVAAGLLAAAPAAHAGRGTGTTLLVLDGPAGQRVRLSGTGGAEVFERRAALPVLAGQVDARRFSFGHRGTLVLRRGARRVTLRDVELRLGRAVTMTARLDGARRTVLQGTGTTRARLDRRRGTARLRDGRVRFAGRLARAFGRGRAGTLSIDATIAPGGSISPTTAPPRPASAVDVTAATVHWHVRDSWVRYLAGGQGIRAGEGAEPLPASVRPGTSQALRYDFRLPFAGGWYDPASDRAVLTTRGRLRFLHRAHGIDFSAGDGQIELTGAERSRATFRFTGSSGTPYDGTRSTLMGLRPGAPQVSGATRAFGDVPGVVPPSSESAVFAGFYTPGDPFGWMTITFTTAG